jgi:CBS domain containing-hemolysin-like protein
LIFINKQRFKCPKASFITVKILEAFLRMQEKQTPLAIVENTDDHYVGIITIEEV